MNTILFCFNHGTATRNPWTCRHAGPCRIRYATVTERNPERKEIVNART